MFKIRACLFVVLMGLMNLLHATQVVRASECNALDDASQAFMVVLKKGENIHQSLLQCMNAAHIDNASISGLGAVKDPSLAYYDLKEQQYHQKTMPGVYELLALNGDVSLLNGVRQLHLHTVIGDHQFQSFGGHLMDGVIGVTGEITVRPMKGQAIRKLDAETGLNLIAP